MSGLGIPVVDGVYFNNQTQQQQAANPAQTGLVAVVGTTNYGIKGTPAPASDGLSAQFFIGTDTLSVHSALREALSAMPEAQQFLFVPIADGTDQAAVINIIDNQTPTPAVLVQLINKSTGSLPNQGNAGAFALLTLFSGTMAADPLFTVQLVFQGRPQQTFQVASYATAGGPYSAASFIANLVATINGTIPNQVGANDWTAVAGTSTNQPNLSAANYASGGTDGNVFLAPPAVGSAPTVTVNGTAGSTEYQYEIVATGDGDAAASSIGVTNTGNASLSNSNYNALSWTAPAVVAGTNGPITGYKILRQVAGTGGFLYLTTVGPSVTSFQDKGQFTPAAYSAAATVSATQALIGNATFGASTGMQALAGMVSDAQVILAGLSDGTAVASLISFSVANNCKVHWAMPPNTTTAQALALQSQYGAAHPNLFVSMDWCPVFDANSGLTIDVSPMGPIAGIIASTPVYLSPGNEPPNGKAGFNATTRISGGINTINSTEAQQRQQAGILYLGYMPRALRGPQLGLTHGMTSDGVTTIQTSRMKSFIIDGLRALEGPFVDGPMSTAQATLGQPTAGQLQDAADAWLGSLLNSSPQQISDYEFLIGANNTPMTTASGLLIPSVQVETLSSAQFIVNDISVGPNVQINSAA